MISTPLYLTQPLNAALLLLALLQASATLTLSLQCDANNEANAQPCFIGGLPTNVTHRVGDSAELLCGVQEIGTRTVYWWKDGDDYPLTIDLHTFISDRRFSVQHKSGVYWNLKIDRVTLHDAGSYICKVSTSPTMQRAVSLHVLKANANASFNGRNQQETMSNDYQNAPSRGDNSNANWQENVVNTEAVSVAISNKTPGPHFVDDRLFLECNVAVAAFNKSRATHAAAAAGYMCDIEWFHNGHALQRDRHKDVLITLPASSAHCRNLHAIISTLVISKLKTKHSGKYFCSFRVIPPRDTAILRSDSASATFTKESGMIDVHVRARNASASVLTASLQTNAASHESLALSLSLMHRLSLLCLLTFYRSLTLV